MYTVYTYNLTYPICNFSHCSSEQHAASLLHIEIIIRYYNVLRHLFVKFLCLNIPLLCDTKYPHIPRNIPHIL